MSAEIKQAFGIDVVLVPGSGGVFDVKKDEELIFSSQECGRFPEKDEIIRFLTS